jgi:hypothetical protein
MAETPESLAERARIQRGRNIALGLVLASFAVLFFAITWAKMGG